MDKVYYLLRNNRKTGPFTIGELLQQGLRPADLIWVDGKSEKWTRVGEMELMPFADHLPQQAPVITLSPEVFQKVVQHDPHPLPDHTEEPIEFIDHRKEKHQAVRELMAAALVTVFVAAGVVGGRTLFLGKRGFDTTPAPQASTKLESTKEYTARQADPERVAGADTTALAVDSTTSAPVAQAARPARIGGANDSAAQVPDTTASEAATPPAPVKQEVEKPAPVREAPVKPVVEAPKKDTTAQEAKADESGEKKKGFLRGLFKKKKKDE